MGYRSDIKIVVLASSKEAMDDLIAVYNMIPSVQKEGGFKELGWEHYPLGEGRVVTFEEGHIKWYLGYNDVDAIMELCELAHTFNQERPDDVYTARCIRVGENMNDVEVYDYGDSYEYDIDDILSVRTEIVLSL